MFQSKAPFEQPHDDEILWRHQDLPRYIDMLLRQQLFFSRADKFEDPFEGKYSLYKNEKLISEQLENNSNGSPHNDISDLK